MSYVAHIFDQILKTVPEPDTAMEYPHLTSLKMKVILSIHEDEGTSCMGKLVYIEFTELCSYSSNFNDKITKCLQC